MSLFAQRKVLLSGEVGIVRTVAASANDRDDNLYRHALEMRGVLIERIEKQVEETLGLRFEVKDFQIESGSAIIYIVLGTIGTIYMGLSRYEGFISSVNLLTDQVSEIVSRVFRESPIVPPSVSVKSTWRPGPALEVANQSMALSSGVGVSNLLLVYLVFSHAALMSILLWLVIRHLK